MAKKSTVDREPTKAPPPPGTPPESAKPKPPPPPGPPPKDLGPPPPTALSNAEPSSAHRGSVDAGRLHRPPGWVPPDPDTANAAPTGAHLTVVKKGGGAAILARKRGGGRKRSSPGRRATLSDLGSRSDLGPLRAFGDGTPGSTVPALDSPPKGAPPARGEVLSRGPPGRTRKSSSLLSARGASPNPAVLSPESPLSAFVDAMAYAYGNSAAAAILSKVRADPSAFTGDERPLVADCALSLEGRRAAALTVRNDAVGGSAASTLIDENPGVVSDEEDTAADEGEEATPPTQDAKPESRVPRTSGGPAHLSHARLGGIAGNRAALLGGRRGRKSSMLRSKRRDSSRSSASSGGSVDEYADVGAGFLDGAVGNDQAQDHGAGDSSDGGDDVEQVEQPGSWIETESGDLAPVEATGEEATDTAAVAVDAAAPPSRGRGSSTGSDGPAHLSHARLGATGNRDKLLRGRRGRKSSTLLRKT